MRRRSYCKAEIAFVKFVPMFTACIVTVSNFLSFSVNRQDIVDFFFLPSVLSVIHMYFIRSIYRLCKFYRLFIDYVAVSVFIRIHRNVIIGYTGEVFLFFLYNVVFVLYAVLIYVTYVRDNPKIACKDDRPDRHRQLKSDRG